MLCHNKEIVKYCDHRLLWHNFTQCIQQRRYIPEENRTWNCRWKGHITSSSQHLHQLHTTTSYYTRLPFNSSHCHGRCIAPCNLWLMSKLTWKLDSMCRFSHQHSRNHEDHYQKMPHEDRAPEDDSRTKCCTFLFFCPRWPWSLTSTFKLWWDFCRMHIITIYMLMWLTHTIVSSWKHHYWISLMLRCRHLWYGDSAGNTAENSSIFSLIRMR